MERPGCVAADESIVALGHLDGLARGLGGFGVLRTSKARLEHGARAAEHLGHHELAHRMKEIANEMPNVRDLKAAEALAARLKPLVDTAWELGRRCEGYFSPALLQKARSLGVKVQRGQISRDDAVSELSQEIGG